MQTVAMTVEPAMAAKWLAEDNHGNRPISSAHVAKLKKAIVDNQFHHTHQGIAFYDDGTLADGQHRLTAIAQSGKSVLINVTFGVAKTAFEAIDQQSRGRTLRDTMNMEGVVDAKQYVAIARHWMILKGNWTAANHEVKAFIDEHKESIGKVLELAKGNVILKHAAVATVMAMGVEKGHFEPIARWADILRTGIVASENESAAIRFRDYWTKDKKTGSQVARIDYSHRTYSSLRAFIDNRPLTKLYAADVIDWL